MKDTVGTEVSCKLLSTIASENSSSTVESTGTRVEPCGGVVRTSVGGV
ncbi:hypothetical protein DB31_7217 [Hyalangium minutum]|uniref:Uncharacterized protein n=1 Tax=Hyalangium minutum TaxID=394096 RepID=A0A085WJW7_9BACT|nr:hypothetical protein DB31_7217 [Hyalangium minutum]